MKFMKIPKVANLNEPIKVVKMPKYAAPSAPVGGGDEVSTHVSGAPNQIKYDHHLNYKNT